MRPVTEAGCTANALLIFCHCATVGYAQVLLNDSGVAVLNDYVTAGTQWLSRYLQMPQRPATVMQQQRSCAYRGTWYNILDWAARSTTCNNAPDSVACMACSQSMPAYSKPAGVAPIGNVAFCMLLTRSDA